MCVCIFIVCTRVCKVVKLTCMCVCYVQQNDSDIHQDVLAAMTSVAKLQEQIGIIKTHTLPVRCNSIIRVVTY